MKGAGVGTEGVRLGDLAGGETTFHLVEGEEVGRCFLVGSTGGGRRSASGRVFLSLAQLSGNVPAQFRWSGWDYLGNTCRRLGMPRRG